MIQSFADATTRDLYHGRPTREARAIDPALWPVVRRKLDRLNAATELRDLFDPGSRLKALKGRLAGWYELRVNRQYRIYFHFTDGHAYDVRVGDDH